MNVNLPCSICMMTYCYVCLFAIQRQGFGRRQVYKHILIEPMDDLLKQIGYVLGVLFTC